MSGYRQGHEEGNPYINYGAPPDSHSEERIFTHPHPQNIPHGGPQSLHPLHGGHTPHLHPSPSQQHQYPQHQVFTGQPNMSNPHQQPSHYGGRQDMMPSGGQMQHATGTKRTRPDELGGMGGMGGLPAQQMSGGHQMSAGMSMGGPSSMGQPMSGYGMPEYHTHALPHSMLESNKRPRTEGEPNMSMGAPSMVGMEGMPEPAAKPRGPKLKFTPEDDQLLVDLKENKSLTWKQIAEFFPGRSSGTLQVRYCTKLKAKTTQWTDETIQKLQTALHDYEQEKWRIIAQKVGTGFTSTACKEKAEELAGGGGGDDDDDDGGGGGGGAEL